MALPALYLPLPDVPAPLTSRAAALPAMPGMGDAIVSIADALPIPDTAGAIARRMAGEIISEWDREAGTMARYQPRQFADFAPEEQALAQERSRFGRQVEDVARSRHCSAEDAALTVQAMYSHCYPILSVKGRGGKSALTYRNYRQWRQQLIDRAGRADWSNLEALLDAYAHGPRRRPGDAAFWAVFLSFYLTEQQRELASCYRKARQVYLANVPVHAADAVPSRHQVDYWCRTYLPPALEALYRQGRKKFRDAYQGHIFRDWSQVLPNEIWFGDHHTLDLWVQWTDPSTGNLTTIRPTLSAWRDAKSGMFVGWLISCHAPNHLSILATFLQGVHAAGMTPPDWLYMDNGSDYRKEGMFLPVKIGNIEYSMLAALDTRPHYGGCYNGKEKPVERDFAEVCREFSHWIPSYCGNSPAVRPEDLEKIRTRHPERFPAIDEVRNAFASWLGSCFHATPKPQSIITDGRAPADIWREYLAGSRHTVGERDLAMACLMPVRLAEVGRGCTVELQHPYLPSKIRRDRVYESYDLYQYLGRKVVVGVCPWSDDYVFFWHPETGRRLVRADGSPIVAARPQQAAPLGADAALLAALKRQINSLPAQCRADYAALTDGIPALMASDTRALIALPKTARLAESAGDRQALPPPLPADFDQVTTPPTAPTAAPDADVLSRIAEYYE